MRSQNQLAICLCISVLPLTACSKDSEVPNHVDASSDSMIVVDGTKPLEDAVIHDFSVSESASVDGTQPFDSFAESAADTSIADATKTDSPQDSPQDISIEVSPDSSLVDTGGDSAPTSCLVSKTLASWGRTEFMIGASMTDNTAKAAPFALRYMYLSAGLFDSNAPCSSCATSCTSMGVSCANSNPNGCAWWGCWQSDAVAPGAYVRDFIAKAKAATPKQLPMITYYQLFTLSGYKEGAEEVAAAKNVSVMSKFFTDYRFLLQQVGNNEALLHIEPDFWGYCQQLTNNPHQLQAAVQSANATDCASEENSIAGFGKCLIKMTRKYAPNAKVSLHHSAWATNFDTVNNKDSALNIAAEAQKLAAFMKELGHDQADVIVVDAADRDADYYRLVKSRDSWWDDTNSKLPHFKQAFAWSKALAEASQKPILWWQLPVGNTSRANKTNTDGTGEWKDNRVAYFLSHLDEVIAAHGIGAAFGAGDKAQTRPENDGGFLISRVQSVVGSAVNKKLCYP